MQNQSIKTVGLFSGGGGLDLGFSIAGYNIILSSDIDSHSCKSLELNQEKRTYLKKHPVICEDVRNITGKKIQDIIGTQVDFLIGGPPCQAFSIFGKRKGLEDPRGNLVYEYTRIIEEVAPQGFLFENVAGLKTIHDGTLYKQLLEALSINGKYQVSAHEYEVADYGIPQFRKRIFFIGSLQGKPVPQMETTHTSVNNLFNAHRPYTTVGQVLTNMPTPITNWKGQTSINGHVGRNHSERIIQRYKGLKFGERDPRTRINKLAPNRPSYTIIVGSDKGGGKGHVHPFQPREVTPRESARLQTFPDWWEFSGTGRHIIRQVGNAVPPLFAALLAAHVAEHLFNIPNELTFDKAVNKLELKFLQHDHSRLVQP